MADDTPKLSRTFDRAASCTASEISELENNLVQLICKEGHKNGISLSDFPIYYEKTFRKRLDITRLGYSSLLQFLVHNPSVFRIKKSPLNGSIIIRDANKYCEDKRKVPEEIEKQIVDIMDSFLALYTDDFEKEFRKKFRKPFRAVDYGFLHNDEIILRMKGFLKFGVLGYNRAILYFDKIEYEQQKKQTITATNGPPFRICVNGFVMEAQLLPKDYSRQSRISIRISRVVKPSELYIQLSEKYDELEQLMSAINQRYNVTEHLGQEENYSFQIDDLQIGMFCVCKYNNRWHRACIASVDDLNHIKVKLIDYGMFHCVDHTNLRYLFFDFANLPAQSICVTEVALAAYENDEHDSDLVCSILEGLSLLGSHLMQVLKYTPKEHFEVKNKLAVLKCQLYREPDIEPILPGIESVSAGNKPVSAGTEPISALISRMVFDDVPRGTNNTTTSTNLGVSGSSYDFHHFSNGSAAYPSPTSGSMYAGYPSSSYLSQALYQPTTYPHVAPCPIPYSFFTLEYMPTNYYTQQLQNVYAHQTSLNSNADALRSPYLDNHLPSYGDTGGPINLLNDRTLQMGGHEMPAEMNSSSFSNVGGYNDGGITLDMNRLSLLVNENVDSGSSAFLNAENLELGNSGQQNIMGQASQLDMVGQENKPYMIEKSTQHDNFLRKFIGRGPQSEARSCISLDKDLVDFDPLSRLSERNERIVGLTNGRSEMSENNDFSFCSELLNEMWASTEADEALTNHSQIET